MVGNLIMRNNLNRGLPTTYSLIYQGNEAVSWQQAVRLTQDSVQSLATKECVDNSVGSVEGLDTSDLANREHEDDCVSDFAAIEYADNSVGSGESIDTSNLATRV